MAFGTVSGTFQGNNISIPASFAAALSTGSGAVVVGDLVVAVIGEQTSLTVSAVTDNLGNTYTAQNAGTLSGTSVSGRAFYSRVTNAGTISSITATCTSSSDNGVIVAAIIQGPFVATPIDGNPANLSDISSPFTGPATGTLAQANEVVIAWISSTGSNALSATSPNILAIQQASASVLEVALGTQVVSATTSVAPAFTGIAPTADVLGTMSFKQAPAAPNGWFGLTSAKAAVAALAIATQATNFAAPPPPSNTITGTGWYQQLSTSAPVAKAQQGLFSVPLNPIIPPVNPTGWRSQTSTAALNARAVSTQATTFAVPPSASNTVTQVAWQQPLSVAVPVAQTVRHQATVPFNRQQVVATTPSGWQTTQSSAPARAVINGSGSTFVVAPFAVPTPNGWQSQPSVAAPVAKVQQGFASVPFTTQVVPQGWQQPLSTAVAVAKAQQGFVSSPLAVTPPTTIIPLVQDASTARTATVYYQSLFNPLPPLQTVIVPPPNGWAGAVSNAAKTAVAQPTQATTFAVPPSPSNNVSQFGWYQPLSKSAPVVSAQQGNTFVPFDTAQAVVTLIPLVQDTAATTPANVYYQSLFNPIGPPPQPSVEVIPLVQDTSATTPTNVYHQALFAPLRPVAAPAPIAGMAWFMPLGTAAKSIPTASQGMSFVPLDTAQLVPPPPPPNTQPDWKPFLTSMGRLSCIG